MVATVPVFEPILHRVPLVGELPAPDLLFEYQMERAARLGALQFAVSEVCTSAAQYPSNISYLSTQALLLVLLLHQFIAPRLTAADLFAGW